jgi:hypothetical protein
MSSVCLSFLGLKSEFDQAADGVRTVSVLSGDEARAVVAKCVFPAEVMADLVQMIAADRPEPGAAFVRRSTDASTEIRSVARPVVHAGGFFLCTFRDVLNVQFAFFSAGSAAAIAGPIVALS